MKRDLPAISSEIAARPRGQIEAIREAVQILIGTRGEALDRAITFRDIVRNADGSISIGGGTAGGTPGGGTIVINPPGAGEEPDLTPPPTPTGLVVTAGLSNIYVEWEVATYLMGHGPGQTNVYGCPWPETDLTPPTFSEAVLVGVAPHAMTLYTIETEPSTRWCVWIKFQTADGVESATPAGGANGAQATTSADIGALLDLLNGQITASQLHAALGARIDLIDGPASLPGSVAARVQTVQSTATNAQTTADAAAALATTVQAQVNEAAGIEPLRAWTFASGADGWSASAATLTPDTGTLVWAPTSSNATLSKTFTLAERFSGAQATLVRARVKRIAGTGAWEGNCYYSTAGHVSNASFVKTIAAPANPGDWTVLEWDMRALTAGGSDWTSNEILGLRIDLVSDGGSQWRIDWIVVGAPNATPLHAAVAQEITARASADGYLGAQYTLRLTAGNLIGGFGISGTAAPDAQPTIDFGIRANKFFIAPPEGSPGGIGNIVPFVVQTTSQVVNGVTIPAGVYMDAAYIKNLNALTARLGNAWITNAMVADLSAAKITAGSITTGAHIQSANYVGGSAGWRIQGNGYAEFSDVVIRGATYTGTIFSGSGTIGGISITATGLQSTNYVPGVTGFQITTSGQIIANSVSLRGAIAGGAHTAAFTWPAAGGTGFHLSANGLRLGNANDARYFQVLANGDVSAPEFSIVNGNATFAGALSAASGTFTGALSAATGSFSGTLTAAAINAVKTINIAGQAVTVPASAEVTEAQDNLTLSYQTLCQATLNSEGQPCIVIALFRVNFIAGSVTMNIRITVDGVEERMVVLSSSTGGITQNVTLIALAANPPTGNYVVRMQAVAGSTTARVEPGSAMVILGCKR